MDTRKRIGSREVRALAPGQIIWDALPGFGARRRKTAAVSHFLFYRAREGRQAGLSSTGISADLV